LPLLFDHLDDVKFTYIIEFRLVPCPAASLPRADDSLDGRKALPSFALRSAIAFREAKEFQDKAATVYAVTLGELKEPSG